MSCKYNNDEICTNDQCPAYADYCPVPNIEGVCAYENKDEYYKLTPKGCLYYAFLDNDVYVNDDTFNLIWNSFSECMADCGYIYEEMEE